MSEPTTQPPVAGDAPPIESDFSWRKIKIATVCLVAITFGTTYPMVYSLAFLLQPMTQAFHWNRTEFSFAATLMFAGSAVTMPICGWISDRLGVRWILMISALCVGVISLAMSVQQGSLLLFYLGYGAIGVLGGGGILYGKVIAALFTKHRGKALAIFGAESALALAALPIMTNLLIHSFGWRGVYVGFAVALFAVAPMIYLFLEEPGVVGGLPKLGQKRAAVAAQPLLQPPPALEGMTLMQAFADRNFWLLILAAIGSLLVYSGLGVHMVALITEKGFSRTLATTAISSTLIIGVFGSLIAGTLADHFQSAKIAAAFYAFLGLGALALLVVTPQFGGPALLFAGFACAGMAVGAQQTLPTYFITRFFGLKAFNAINATRVAMSASIMSLSAPLVGLIYDRAHSYSLAFELTAAGALIGVVLIFLTGRFRYAANVGHEQAPEKTDISPTLEAAPAPAE